MLDGKRPGWYYVTGGRLRYRNEDGWTEHYLDVGEVKLDQWPPPPPMSMLDQVLAQRAEGAAGSRTRVSWWRRRRRLH